MSNTVEQVCEVVRKVDEIIGDSPLRLHLGCGNVSIPGYVNIDCRYQPAVDRVDNIGILHHYGVRSVDAIYCCHALDHFSRWDYQRVLKRWFDLLKPGGTLRISTPDFHKIVHRYLDNDEDLRSLIGSLYAGQEYESNCRKVIFNYAMLREDLIAVGFRDVRTFEPFVDDCSKVWSSLNVEAVK